MRAETVSIRDLTQADVRRWNAWAAPGGQLTSPYLLHDFAEAVDRVRRDVRVTVMRDGGEAAGFFAHHAPKGGIVRPVGSPKSRRVARPATEPHLGTTLGSRSRAAKTSG